MSQKDCLTVYASYLGCFSCPKLRQMLVQLSGLLYVQSDAALTVSVVVCVQSNMLHLAPEPKACGSL